jgi:hypothetical protein
LGLQWRWCWRPTNGRVYEIAWGKQRIMEVYLNVVEWGPGIYGAEAAARHYFHKPAAALTIGEAVRLAQCFQTLSTGHRSAQPDAFSPAALGFIRICRPSSRAVPALPAERSARGRATGGSHLLRTRRRSCCTRDQRRRLVRSRNRPSFSSRHGARDRAHRDRYDSLGGDPKGEGLSGMNGIQLRGTVVPK